MTIKIVRFIVFWAALLLLVVPAAAMLTLVAVDAYDIILGTGWQGGHEAMTMLCIAFAAEPFMNLLGGLMNWRKRW